MKKINTIYSVRDGGHYSPGIVCGGLLYVSGQLSIDPETGEVPTGGTLAEARQALKNLDTVLQAAGVPRENVLQCRVYVSDVAYWGDLNKAYGEYFGDHKPARVVVPTGPLYGGCRVEIEAVAACEE